MKKLIILFFVLSLFLIPLITQASSASLAWLKGYILLQVQANGEAWYVNPLEYNRYYLKDGATAYQMMRSFGLGITNADLSKIPVGIESRFQETDTDNDGLSDNLEVALGSNLNNPDSDGDSYSDGTEVVNGYSPLISNGPKVLIDSALVNRLRGRILLQVESKGEAWYVNPKDSKRYYMKDGDSAYQIMRYLSLGITDSNLNLITAAELNSSAPVISNPASFTIVGMVIEIIGAIGTKSESHYIKIRQSNGREDYIFNQQGYNYYPDNYFENFIDKNVTITGYYGLGRIGWQGETVEGIYVEKINLN